MKYFGNVEDFTIQNASLVIQKLFENFWDVQEYEKLYGFPPNELMTSEFVLNCEQFQKCLDKLSVSYKYHTFRYLALVILFSFFSMKFFT